MYGNKESGGRSACSEGSVRGRLAMVRTAVYLPGCVAFTSQQEKNVTAMRNIE